MDRSTHCRLDLAHGSDALLSPTIPLPSRSFWEKKLAIRPILPATCVVITHSQLKIPRITQSVRRCNLTELQFDGTPIEQQKVYSFARSRKMADDWTGSVLHPSLVRVHSVKDQELCGNIALFFIRPWKKSLQKRITKLLPKNARPKTTNPPPPILCTTSNTQWTELRDDWTASGWLQRYTAPCREGVQKLIQHLPSDDQRIDSHPVLCTFA